MAMNVQIQGKDANNKPQAIKANVGQPFTPSQYDADLTMNGAAQSVALATGVSLGNGKVRITNLGVTTEAIRFAFGVGTTGADAEANLTHVTNRATTGLYIPSSVDVPGGGIVTLGVPALATYYAVENAAASDTQVVSITQGV